MRYAHPGTEGAIVSFKSRYGNYIGGEFVAPVKGQYFTNTSPVNGQPIAEFPRSTAEDIDKALDAAHAAADAWGARRPGRSLVLLKIADRIEQNLELLAITETWDNGKPSAKPSTPTFRWPPTTSATSPAASAPRKAAPPKSTATPWPITSTNRWAWSGRSSRGTSRS
jgi:aldehyde dehydrogenase